MIFKTCYNRISPKDVMAMMETNKGAVFIDVRERDEYRGGHIPGSVNIPLGRLDAMKDALPENKQAPVITYCLSGMRAKNACEILSSLGYSNIYCMGGIHSWPYGLE